MEILFLPYLTDCEVTVDYTNLGYAYTVDYNPDDYYRNEKIRNNVIVKLDLFQSLTGFFDEETLNSDRKVLVQSLIGGIEEDPAVIAQIMQVLYLEDKKFRKHVAFQYYFNQGAFDKSMYELVITPIVETFIKSQYVLENEACKECFYKHLFTVNGYVYIAVKDKVGNNFLPEGYREEVLSCAKVWNCNNKRYKSAV